MTPSAGLRRSRPGEPSTTSGEDRRILEMAASPISVAEISAHLGVVLGVAKVLIADHVAAGRLDSSGDPSSAASADVSLLERVLDGLQAL